MNTPFAKIHIGKSFDETITAEDVQTYFLTERDESLTLEFKSYDSRGDSSFSGILRTIAAFLNSEGGLLIFGAPPEVRKSGNYRVVQGAPTSVPTKATTKDDLIRRISDNISYMPIGILVSPVLMPDDGFVYLIEVPEGINKPYQYEKRYPIRLDGQSQSAPHYLVEALFKQERVPTLSGFLRIVSYHMVFAHPSSRKFKIQLKLHVSIFNESKYINDTGVYLDLNTNVGNFVPITYSGYQFRDGGVIVKDASPVLTYALSTGFDFTYELSEDEISHLLGAKEDFKLELSFGSQKSITRRSRYYVTFKNAPVDSIINNVYTKLSDLTKLLTVRKEENLSLNERLPDDPEDKDRYQFEGI